MPIGCCLKAPPELQALGHWVLLASACAVNAVPALPWSLLLIKVLREETAPCDSVISKIVIMGFLVNGFALGLVVWLWAWSPFAFWIGLAVWMISLASLWLAVWVWAHLLQNAEKALDGVALVVLGFLVTGVKQATNTNLIWILPVCAALPAYVAYSVVHWTEIPNSSISCTEGIMTADECHQFIGKNESWILDNYGHCCQIKDNTFDFTIFTTMLFAQITAIKAAMGGVFDGVASMLYSKEQKKDLPLWVSLNEVELEKALNVDSKNGETVADQMDEARTS